ncbi:MAG: response regulator, partial [Terrimicrobiaceae bacterium]
PDILLMDISLRGEIDGIAASIEIQRITGSPVVFLTGHSDEMTKSKAASAGASAYLLKPYLQSELKAAMESILQKKLASPS